MSGRTSLNPKSQGSKNADIYIAPDSSYGGTTTSVHPNHFPREVPQLQLQSLRSKLLPQTPSSYCQHDDRGGVQRDQVPEGEGGGEEQAGGPVPSAALHQDGEAHCQLQLPAGAGPPHPRLLPRRADAGGGGHGRRARAAGGRRHPGGLQEGRRRRGPAVRPDHVRAGDLPQVSKAGGAAGGHTGMEAAQGLDPEPQGSGGLLCEP